MNRLSLASFPLVFRKACTSRFPGFLVALVISIASLKLGNLAPVVGAPICAILLGILFRLFVGVNENLKSGVAFTSKKVLQFAIILLGAGLNLQTIFSVGKQSFAVMIGSLLAALIGGHLIGRMMKLPIRIVSLITVGTGICGASAISSLSPIIEATENEIAYSISTIFLFNVLAVFLFPLIGHLFHFTNQVFGVWAGTAINDTSSVVAAGFSFSAQAGAFATVVKLTRSLMIIPVCLIYLIANSIFSRKSVAKKNSVKFPLFIIGFIAMSILNTAGWFGQHTGQTISQAGQFFIVVALAAVGLSSDLRGMARTGFRPLCMGLLIWTLVAASSLILQHLTGEL